ncbi:polymorphic toxin-type HINT domain-containing protein [Streptomyces sp. MS1.HAVA.3]|uniref:Polymorphic toxin-type HINT domain-containing protein n=1 Tax=Streptomyces caledonius TaxID=3134107 RepID=A0ABU8U923_9ACTN
MTTNPTTGEKEVREVSGTIVTEDDKDFVELTVTTTTGEKSLVSTVTHPFWVEGEQDFVNAGDLQPGMLLRTPEGVTAPVSHLRFFEERQRTHDLTIEGIHAFYVLIGDTPVLVHNQGGELAEGEIYLWRAVQGRERDDIRKNRVFKSTQGIKYFAFSEHGAAEYARRAHKAFPKEGSYTMVRTKIMLSDLPESARMAYTTDVVGGGAAVQDDVLSKMSRPQLMPSMSC